MWSEEHHHSVSSLLFTYDSPSHGYDTLARAADGPHDDIYYYLRERAAEAVPGDDIYYYLRERVAEAAPGDDEYYYLRERVAEAAPGAKAAPGDDEYYYL